MAEQKSVEKVEVNRKEKERENQKIFWHNVVPIRSAR